MSPQEIVISLTKHIRDQVRPHLGRTHARRITGKAQSGDATFAIDDIAEQAIVEFIEREKLSLAYYSEDKGLIEFGCSPEAVLVIDPIDGTRPAIAGFEQCVVAVSWADYTPKATMADVRYGCIAELKQSDLFFAERGHGTKWWDSCGELQAPALLPVEEVRHAPLSFEIAGRPLEYIVPALADIVNSSSLTAGCFVFNSSAYSLSRLLTGQLAGVLDIGSRLLAELPETRGRFVETGCGTPIGIFTYDIAAAALIAREAGAVVTDAFGNGFDRIPLLDTSEANLQSLCAASNPTLHERYLEAIERGIARLKEKAIP
jgi:myo-inositol-1(or 4)-monophosphatase